MSMFVEKSVGTSQNGTNLEVRAEWHGLNGKGGRMKRVTIIGEGIN